METDEEKMAIRPADADDIDVIMNIYDVARAFMRRCGIIHIDDGSERIAYQFAGY